MARTSNNGGDSRTGENKAAKAPAKTPARRRSDKARQAAAASESAGVVAAGRTAAGVSPMAAAAAIQANGRPSEAEVARLAYELYVRRGCCDGYDKEDWFEAERRLRGQH